MSISGNVMNILETAEKKMNAALDHLMTELNNIRTGRAKPAILDGVSVEVYGTQMRLKDVATVNVPESRQLLVTPYDASTAAVIGKGIEKANLGFQVVVDGNSIRIMIPPMDENVRNEMVKQCHKKCEDGKVSVRNVRRECNDYLRKQKADGEIPEDMEKRLEKDIQELTDKFCKKTDEMSADKEKEILEI